jgi:hypothetical protein
MRRTVAGLLLVAHGLAHTLAGMRATESAHPWLLTLAWGTALVGFVGAGLGLLGVRAMRPVWRRLAAAGIVGSVVLLAVGWPTPLAAAGLLVDGLVACLVLYSWNRESPGTGARARRPAARALEVVATAALASLAVLVAARPWHMRWGSTPAELRARLPGDDPLMRPTYQIQHAVTVRAGPDRIWPWLVLAPLGFALFEPAHFIMQRKMLLTLKERAER